MPCSGRTQRKLSVDGRRLAPAHRLGPGEGADDRGDRLGQHVGGLAAGLVDHREQHAVALDQIALGQAGLAQEPFERLRRGADARALHFLADRCGLGRQVARDQREPARRREGHDRIGARARPSPARPRTAARDRRAPCPASAREFPRSAVRAGSRSCSASPGEGRGPVAGGSRWARPSPAAAGNLCGSGLRAITPPTRSCPSTPGNCPSPGRARGRYTPAAPPPRSRRAR